MQDTIHQLTEQISNFQKQLESAKNNPHLSLPVLDAYENAVYKQ